MFRRLTNIFLTLVIFGFLTFFVPIIIDELFGFRLELDRTNIYFIYIYLLILYYFVIFIHEIGHLTLGCFCKFKFHLLHVGPLIYYKDGRRKQLLITTNELLGGTSGMYISNTKDTKYLRIKHFFYTLGGYLFNIFGALLSLTILSIAEFSSESFNFIVQTFFIFNISLVIFDILTTQENSDFISLYNSIFHKNKDYLSCIPLLFSSEVRPCELNLSNLEFKDKKWNIYLNYYKYYQSLDRNEQEKALRIIRQLKKDMTVYTSEVDDFFKANINYEFLFCCFLTNDIKTTKNVYQEIQENHKEVHPLCKPRSLASYELLINENVKESQKTYEECYQDFHVPFFKGMEIFGKSMAEKYNFVS